MLNLFSIPKVSCYFDNFPPKKNYQWAVNQWARDNILPYPKNATEHRNAHHRWFHWVPWSSPSGNLFNPKLWIRIFNPVHIYIYLSLSPQSELGGVHAPFSKETGRFTRKYQETYMLQAVTRIHVPWNLRSEFSPISAVWPAPVPSPSPGQRGLHCWNQSVRTGNLRRLQTSQSAYVYI